MCVVKKYGLKLRRQFVSNHCVATIKNTNLVDLCLFSGEGTPTLLGGYVLSQKEAFDMGKGLMNSSGFLKDATEEERKKVIDESVYTAYELLKGINAEQAEQLREMFDIKVVKHEQPKEDHGYIG